MELNISHWNEITSYLNGYVLKSVEIRGSSLFAVNSEGDSFIIATRSPVFWNSAYGKAYEAVELILRNTADELKSDGIYSSEEKDKVLLRNLERVVKLHTKGYKS